MKTCNICKSTTNYFYPAHPFMCSSCFIKKAKWVKHQEEIKSTGYCGECESSGLTKEDFNTGKYFCGDCRALCVREYPYLKRTISIQEEYWTVYKNEAHKNGIEWKLTPKEFCSFWQKSCTKCGKHFETLELSRIDESKGFSFSNCVSKCWEKC